MAVTKAKVKATFKKKANARHEDRKRGRRNR